MPCLELEQSMDRFRQGWDDSEADGNTVTGGSRNRLAVTQGGCVPALIPGRVLLVEPAESERKWLHNELIAGQMEVFEATDLITAMRSISIFQPNVVVAQLQMPTYSGIELLRRLRQEPATQFTPVVLYCNLASADDRVHALELGANDVLSKPFTGAEMLARLRLALRNLQLLAVLEERAHLDGLTGLANRRVLDDRLPGEWEACRRRGVPLAVVIADLDHFKLINDRHGHAAGDRVLRESALTLAKAVRASDTVARYGGEEFVVVAPDCDLKAAVKLAERFRAAIARMKVAHDGTEIPVTTSVGVAAFADFDKGSPAELLKRADEALYRAKSAGRDATWVWEQDQSTPRSAAGKLDIEP